MLRLFKLDRIVTTLERPVFVVMVIRVTARDAFLDCRREFPFLSLLFSSSSSARESGEADGGTGEGISRIIMRAEEDEEGFDFL